MKDNKIKNKKYDSMSINEMNQIVGGKEVWKPYGEPSIACEEISLGPGKIGCSVYTQQVMKEYDSKDNETGKMRVDKDVYNPK